MSVKQSKVSYYRLCIIDALVEVKNGLVLVLHAYIDYVDWDRYYEEKELTNMPALHSCSAKPDLGIAA